MEFVSLKWGLTYGYGFTGRDRTGPEGVEVPSRVRLSPFRAVAVFFWWSLTVAVNGGIKKGWGAHRLYVPLRCIPERWMEYWNGCTVGRGCLRAVTAGGLSVWKRSHSALVWYVVIRG